MPFLPLNTLFAQGTVMQIVQSPKSMGIYMEDDHAGGGNRVIFMDGRPHAPAKRQVLSGRFARPLGRQHAGRRDHEFLAGLPWIQHRHVQDDRTLHARGREQSAARNHLRRSKDVDQAVDRSHRDGQDRRSAPHDLRFRLPRGELRHDRHPGRRPQGRASREEESHAEVLPILLLLAFGSGVAALIYEIVWFQLLELVIGSTAVSLGMLLATFMGGMCLGSLILPRLVSARRILCGFTPIELGIGVLGILVLLLMPFVGASTRLERIRLAWIPAPRSRRRRVPSAPDLADGRDAARPGSPSNNANGVSWLGFLYGANIAGAVFGCLLSGFYLLRVYDVATRDLCRRCDQRSDCRASHSPLRGPRGSVQLMH